jgi:hypothetical protein
MKLKNCSRLNPIGFGGVCYRAVPPQYLATVLQTGHTATVTTRFSSGSLAHPQFEILYLSENPVVALFEVQALLGSWHGVNVPNPHVFSTIVSVQVRLSFVADLTIDPNLRQIGTTVQELTGDWGGYSLRSPISPTNKPYYSHVPTQQLGHALNQVPDMEGFLTYSARVPDKKNLVVFPKKLRRTQGSSLVCRDSGGNLIDQIP